MKMIRKEVVMTDRERKATRRRREEDEVDVRRQSTKSSTNRNSSSKKKRVREEEAVPYRNAAKSTHTPDKRRRKSAEKERKRTRKEQRKLERRNRISRNVGMGLAAIQLLASIVFIVAIFMLGMLPTKYLVAIMILLILLCGLLLMGQFFSKKNAIVGKIISIIIIIALSVGSFFIFKANSTLSSIMSSGTKIDNIVVAVLIDDPAETIEDALDYTYGAQYALSGDHVTETVEAIETEYNTTLDVTEYSDMGTLATALQSGEVQAIIYNSSYSALIEEENPDYENEIKIIHTYSIVTELEMEDSAADIEVSNETFYVYISGIDVYGSISQNSRSDVNIIAEINPTTQEILLINTPRDYYVPISGVSGDSCDKLTHAGIYGIDTSIATLEELYDIDIDFYARVNFTSLIEMVDALGGISVYSEYSFTSTLHAGLYTLYVNSGYNDFDGTDALIFARERYNVTGGDETRGENQQQVIISMIEKATSPAIITSASTLLDIVADNMETNMTDSQIQDLIKMQISDDIDWTIETISVTGTSSSQYCYSYSGSSLSVIVPDYDSVEEAKAKMLEFEFGSDYTVEDDSEEDTEEESSASSSVEITIE